MSIAPRRLGILRPTRVIRVIADAEARVIRTELERRLGPVSIDLRIDGNALGQWLPRKQAAWPSDVDAVIDGVALWGDPPRPLTPLFARTVEPAAADTRRRMLTHLGVLPDGAFILDDDIVRRLTEPIRPTDLWLLVDAAVSIAVDDPGVRALVSEPADIAAADHRFDQLAASLDSSGDSGTKIARLTAALDGARSDAAVARNETARAEVEAEVLILQLESQLAALDERLARSELDRPESTTT